MSTSFGITDDKELLRKVSEGDERAFSELFHSYRAKLYTYIFKLTDSKESAEDTVHDVFLKIWANRTSLMNIDNFGGYLFRMAHNHAVNAFRRMAKETLILAELRAQQASLSTDQPATLILCKEVQEYILQAVSRLTPRQREVFLLSREVGMKQDAIAQHLQISVFAVKKHMVDALKALRDDLGGYYGSMAVAIFVLYQLELH